MIFNRIYAHRGFWCVDGTQKHKMNSFTAIQNVIESGFGAEIDLKDLRNEVIVIHDPPAANTCFDKWKNSFYTNDSVSIS